MPREIKTTIAVDGEAAFKRSINEANTSMKNLGTQLTLAQAQFKKDGDAMKLMETRSKALNGQISQQEEIVKALEKAVGDSTKAYGANSEKTEKWEAELNRAKAKLVNLQNELTLNEQGLDRSGRAFDDSAQHAADYQATLQGIGRNVSFEAITSGIHNVTGVIEGAIKKVWNFAKAIRETFADAGEWADDLMTDATKYGMDVETLQRWQNAADFIDTPVETIIGARDKLGKKMKEGWKDGQLDMWEFLGIDLKDAEGKYRDKMDVMFEVGETLMNMARIDGDDVRADAYAMQVFGKSWRELMPLFTAGSEQWEKTINEQTVVSEKHVQALGELDDANQALENSWDVTKYSFLAELAPTITTVTEKVTELLQAFNEWMETDEGKQAMQDLSDAIKELFSGLGDVKFGDAIDAVKDAINGIKSALVWVEKHKDEVKVALEVIGAGFAAIKIAELATNIGKIVSGFQTLWSGANNPMPQVPTGGSPSAPTGGTGTGVGTGVGTAAGGGIKAFLAQNGLSFLTPAAVVAAAVTPAILAQKANESEWINEYESTEATAAAAEAAGYDAGYLRRLNAAAGPKSDGNGGYKRGLFGFLDMNPTEQAEQVLQSLGDLKTRGILYSDIHRYGDTENDNILGWRPWTMMERYWGIGEYADQPLNQQEITALVEYLRDIETKKAEEQANRSDTGSIMEDAVAEMKVNTASTEKAAETMGKMDLKRFNQVPGNMETGAERGIRRGINGVKVDIDGRTAGKILAPYINEYLGQNAQ